MQVKFIGTGSAGNCIAIQNNAGHTILIDAGVPKTKLEKRLIEFEIDPASVQAIFLTHEHGDHVQGLPFAEKWQIPVYGSGGTINAVGFGFAFNNTDEGIILAHSGFSVEPFRVHHDAYDAFGYVVKTDWEKACICLDTGHVDADMIAAMRGSNIIVIEANHDEDMLEACDKYPPSVKARILSDRGHLSNEQTALALHRFVRGNGEKIYLTHLSKNSNFPKLAVSEVERKLRARGYLNGHHYSLTVV